MKKFAILLLALVTVSIMGEVSQAQLTPKPKSPVNPCLQLGDTVNNSIANRNAWQAILTEKQESLTGHQNYMQMLQLWYGIFWQGIQDQWPQPMTAGQEETQNTMLNLIANQNQLINQLQQDIAHAQNQVAIWDLKVQQAIAAYNAAGC